VTGLSPLQYQKQIRLQEARRRLLAAPGDVTSVALGVGYESTSQFTREYGRLFGLPPAKDAARLLASRPGRPVRSRIPIEVRGNG
jgi:AraC-like DNA-binding protein